MSIRYSVAVPSRVLSPLGVWEKNPPQKQQQHTKKTLIKTVAPKYLLVSKSGQIFAKNLSLSQCTFVRPNVHVLRAGYLSI